MNLNIYQIIIINKIGNNILYYLVFSERIGDNWGDKSGYVSNAISHTHESAREIGCHIDVSAHQSRENESIQAHG